MAKKPKKSENERENFHEDTTDMRKSFRKQYKSRRKKEKEIFDYLLSEHDEEDMEEYYDNFEKW